MLYQTQRLHQHHHRHPNPFHSHAGLPLPATTSSSPSRSPLSSFLQEMEHVQAALKSSLRKELAFRLTLPAFLEDSAAVNAIHGVPADDFSVDDLLDLSDVPGFVEEEPEPQRDGEEEDDQEKPHEASVATVGRRDEDNILSEHTHFSDLGSVTAEQLSVPADEIADLEWLSHFVEDSFSASYLAGAKPTWFTATPTQRLTPVSEESCFKSPVPAKARSKRARTGGRVWSLGSTSLTDSSSSSTTSSSSSSPINSSLWLAALNPASEPLKPVTSEKPKKQKRKAADSASGNQQARRCSHCGVQKTPQWRAGPLGAKTLCNACGVRFKSGRLLPEYRPACSPTFSSELHSNHHRKVLEMRQKKETSMLSEREAGVVGPPPAVSRF